MAFSSGYADFDSFTIESKYHDNHYDSFDRTDFDLYDDVEGMVLVRPIDYDPRQYLVATQPVSWLSFFNLNFARPATGCSIELKARLSNVVIELRDGDANGTLLSTFRLKATGGKWSTQKFKVNIPEGLHKVTFRCLGNADQLQLKNFQFD